MEDVRKARGTRGDQAPSPWRWGSEPIFGGGGNQKVGPGWASEEPRFDSGEIELLIDGRRCVEVEGQWMTAEGEPCNPEEDS
jgi:hypothetical protein